MKKNFFKKLSFVLALAMIVSVLAPAAGAFAAKAPKLNASEKTLHLNVDGKDEFDFNIANKQTGWKYLWTSKNANVATVNKKNGVVTATGAGTTKVSVVITDKDGEEVDELTATVLVRDNIKELTITNLPKDDKVAVGVTHDFNRSYVTVANKTKGSQAITRWSVGEGATIADDGKFTATKAGEYTITARAFQSKAKYADWLKDAEKYASYVTAEATYKVTVAASMVEVKQVDLDTFKVTFDSEVTDTSKLSVFYVVGTAEVASSVKNVSLDADKKVATVDMYVPFTAGGTVVVKYPEMDSVNFVAATKNVSDVDKIEIVTTTAQLQTATDIKVKFLNKDGVDLAHSDFYSRLTFESSNLSSTIASGSSPKLTLYKVGDTTTLTATFHTYNYDPTTGKETGNLTATQVVTCVDKAAANVGNVEAYTVVASSPDYSNAKHSVAIGDTFTLFVRLKGKAADGTTDLYTKSDDAATAGKWNFTSSDTSILNIDPSTGAIYPFKTGSATIVIKYENNIVGTAAVTVTAAREVSALTVSTNSFALSNNNDVQDVKTVDIKVKDQLGSDYSNYTATVTLKSNNADSVLTSYDNDEINFNGAPNGVSGSELAEGAYTYEVKVVDGTTHKELTTYITVNLQKPSSDDVVYYYAVETDKASYDMKLTSTDAAENVTVSLFGYASNNVRNVRLDAVAEGVVIKQPNGAVVDAGYVTNGSNNKVLNLVPVTGGAIKKLDKGAWTATVASGNVVASTYFTVTDTQPTPVVTVNKLYTDKINALDAIKDTITVKVDGADVTSSIVATANTYVGSLTNTKGETTVFIKEVQYTETFGGNPLVHTIPVNVTITYNYQ
jgi:hypothetical protein